MSIFLSLLCHGEKFLSVFRLSPLTVFPPPVDRCDPGHGTNCGGINSPEHKEEFKSLYVSHLSGHLLTLSGTHLYHFNIGLSTSAHLIKLTMRLRRTVLSTQLSRHDTIYRSATQTRAMESVRVYVNNNN